MEIDKTSRDDKPYFEDVNEQSYDIKIIKYTLFRQLILNKFGIYDALLFLMN